MKDRYFGTSLSLVNDTPTKPQDRDNRKSKRLLLTSRRLWKFFTTRLFSSHWIHMATISRARKSAGAGSGGKILRGRQAPTVASPYARPTVRRAPPPPENPNWFLGFVGPATRTIATGAGKLLSTLFGSDSSRSSSSDSSASSSSDDLSDDDISAERDHNLNQAGITSGVNKCSDKELLPIVEKSNTKVAIERLLMQETFSREECNRLTQIIQSRVVENFDAKDGEDAGKTKLHDKTFGSNFEFPGALQSDLWAKTSSAFHSYLGNGFDSLSPRSLDLGFYVPDSQNTVVMEAKKWFEEKKSESRSKLDRMEGIFTSNTYVPNVSEGETGSPVLVAKSYMKARPPWASPSLNNVGFRSPTSIGMHLFKEGTPYSFGGHSFSSSKTLKRSSLVDSWDVLEGTRRVRFKSAEDSCNHICSSLLESEHKSSPTTLMHDKREVEVGAVIHDSNSLPVTRSLDASVHLPTDLAINGGSPVQNGPGNKALSSVPSALISDKTLGLEDEQHTGGEELPHNVLVQHEGLQDQPANIANSEPHLKPLENIKPTLQSDPNMLSGVDSCELDLQRSSQLAESTEVNNSSQPTKLLDLKEKDFTNGSRSPGGSSSTQKEVNRSRDEVLANGFAASTSSLALELSGDSDPRHSNEGDPNPVNTSDDKLSRPVEETCELLSETSVEVPVVEETDSVANGSHDSTRHSKEPLQLETESVSSRGRVRKPSTKVVQKQPESRVGKYSRRSRGRGK